MRPSLEPSITGWWQVQYDWLFQGQCLPKIRADKGFPGGTGGTNPMKEAQAPPLAQEGPLDKAMATTPVVLPGKIPWTEEPGRRATVHGGCKEWDVTEHAHVRATEKHQDRVL